MVCLKRWLLNIPHTNTKISNVYAQITGFPPFRSLSISGCFFYHYSVGFDKLINLKVVSINQRFNVFISAVVNFIFLFNKIFLLFRKHTIHTIKYWFNEKFVIRKDSNERIFIKKLLHILKIVPMCFH